MSYINVNKYIFHIFKYFKIIDYKEKKKKTFPAHDMLTITLKTVLCTSIKWYPVKFSRGYRSHVYARRRDNGVLSKAKVKVW